MRAFLKNRWFLGIMMMLALALVVWFVGPAIAIYDVRPLEGEIVRIAIISVIFSIWLAFELARVLVARQANKKLLDGIAAGGEPEDASAPKADAELQVLRERFAAAAVTLKNARFESATGEKQYLYQLPWYVFIGAPGSGKTTALVNSGLHFPLGDSGGEHAVKGVGGTRNCDWWFTDEAVLLDTAGRYSTQDSDKSADAAAWLGFLDLIKKHRPRRPLNGAIVTVSISDLLVWDDAERQRYCDAVRQRIQELYTRLGVRFPIYILVTKSDLLAGFNEMFALAGKEERAQVWGMTFALPKGKEDPGYGNLFDAEFKGLEDRIGDFMLDRLQQERDQQRRALIYNFPQQFAALKPLLSEFTRRVFQSSRYDEQVLLRGIYFSSGTQEGNPIDRVLGTIARNFSLQRKVLPPAAASGRSFFLTNLMTQVIFPEAGLVGANAKLERRLKILLITGYVATLVITVGLLVLWGISYFNNQSLIAEFDTNARALKEQADKIPPPRSNDFSSIFPLLGALRGLGQDYHDGSKSVPITYGMGLYQGEKLGSQAYRTYLAALRDALLPRIALRLEERLRDGSANPIAQYEVLKAYLMLYSDKNLDPKALTAVMARDWQQTYRGEEQAQFIKGLQEHLQAALADRPLDMVQPQNAELVDRVRQKLASSSLPDRIYARLRLEAEEIDLQPFRISDAAGPSAAQVFVRESKQPLTEGVPGIYTSAGYYRVIVPKLTEITTRMITEESWVLGSKYAGPSKLPNLLPIQEEVRRRYLQDYMKAWDRLFADIQLAPSSSIAQTVQFVRLLSGVDSPLKRLVEAAVREATLSQSPDAGAKASIAKATSDAVSGLTRKAMETVTGKPGEAPPQRPEAVLDEYFRQLREFVVAPAGTRARYDLLADGLKEYGVRLDATAEALKRGDAAGQRLADPGPLKGDVEQAPPPIRQVLKALLGVGTSQATGVAREKMASDVGGAALFCDKAIRGRYPFSRTAQAEVTLDDFGKVFGPGGDLDDFFKKNMAPLVDTSQTQWRARPGDGGATISAQAILQFQRAAEIRDMFFRGAGAPSVSAELKMVQLDDRLTHVTLEIDNQVIRFDRTSGATSRLAWPGQKPGGRVRLQAFPTGAALNFEGAWGLFRLIDRGSPQAGAQPEVLKLAYTLDGAAVGFELRASSAVNNPFRAQTLENFRCPSRS